MIWAHARSAPRRLAGGAVAYEGLVLDVAARRAAEDVIREADRRKDEFLATLEHEFRNPLAPVRSAQQVIRLSPDRPTR